MYVLIKLCAACRVSLVLLKSAGYLLLISAGFLFCGYPLNSYGLDWSAVDGRQITLFYPGQASWEKLLTHPVHKTGARKIRDGAGCRECHADEESELGATLAKGGHELAQSAAALAHTSVAVEVKAAYESGSLHLRLSWPAGENIEAKWSVMLGDDSYRSTAQAGCWAACHDDARGMPGSGETMLTKYLSRSRTQNTRTGGGVSYKTADELASLLEQGQFLELWTISSTGAGTRGYVLEQRQYLQPGNLPTIARLEKDQHVIEVSRPLGASQPGEIPLQPGAVYYFGLAMHGNGREGREHLVSFGYSLAIGDTEQPADLRATGF